MIALKFFTWYYASAIQIIKTRMNSVLESTDVCTAITYLGRYRRFRTSSQRAFAEVAGLPRFRAELGYQFVLPSHLVALYLA